MTYVLGPTLYPIHEKCLPHSVPLTYCGTKVSFILATLEVLCYTDNNNNPQAMQVT